LGATLSNRDYGSALNFTDAALSQAKGATTQAKAITGAARNLLDGVTREAATVNGLKAASNPLASNLTRTNTEHRCRWLR